MMDVLLIRIFLDTAVNKICGKTERESKISERRNAPNILVLKQLRKRI